MSQFVTQPYQRRATYLVAGENRNKKILCALGAEHFMIM